MEIFYKELINFIDLCCLDEYFKLLVSLMFVWWDWFIREGFLKYIIKLMDIF